MRKNKMMRAASALLVAVLLTTSTISGTFAKYVTQDSAKDVARVAKWGVELQVEGNLFGENYVNAIAPDGATAAELAVESNYNLLAEDPDPDDVVAPGTNNSNGFTFSLNGTPEVSGLITSKMEIQNVYLTAGTYGVMVPLDEGVVTAENFDEYDDTLYTEADGVYTEATVGNKDVVYYTLEDMVVLDNIYYPVVFTLAGGTNTTGTNYNEDSLKAVADAIAGKLKLTAGTINNGVYTYNTASELKFNPNTDLTTLLALGAETITWEWAFERKDASNVVIPMYDGADTILGNLIAGNVKVVKLQEDDSYKAPLAAAGNLVNDYCLNLKFLLEITVEQIDGIATP